MTLPTKIQPQTGVLLVDDSSVVLEGIQALLAQNRRVRVVGKVRSTTEALAAIRTCHPNVVVSDIVVGRASGIDLCRTICQSHPHIGVLFFSNKTDKHLLRSAILAGARGYVLKTASAVELVKGIEVVSEGNAIIDPQLTQEVTSWIQEQAGLSNVHRVSECSQDDVRILALLAAGMSNKEIARRFKVTPGVLSTRLRRIYRRLNISRRAEAARLFVEWKKGGET